ncbi:MAG: MerR family transcriptional regulator [Defluviitaleaceae bacterium]|nr:MerR family transcriptional regulator [Defluviitaleaceae bacterium]
MEKLMTVSEIAKEAGVTVRTVQYYDNAGILKPSSYSEGGNRLYTNKELVLLHQIKGLKQLGLTLSEIKQSIVALDEPEKVLSLLKEQKAIIEKNIQNLQSTIYAIDVLEMDVKNSDRVDFEKYAKILSITNEDWSNLWNLKVMNQDLQKHILDRFNAENAIDFYEKLLKIFDNIIQAKKDGVQPDSIEGEKLLNQFATLVDEFLDGNKSLLPSLIDFEGKLDKSSTGGFAAKWNQVASFITSASNAQAVWRGDSQ